jgi:hypothetical protein
MAVGGADEALRGLGGWDAADSDAGAFSESGPGSGAPAGPERDVDIGTPSSAAVPIHAARTNGGIARSRVSD